MIIALAGCAVNASRNGEDVQKGSYSEPNISKLTTEENEDLQEGIILKLYINNQEVPVIWEDNISVSEIAAQAASGDIVIQMSKYGGWEQVGPLGRSYSRNDEQITAHCGDIILYNGNNIVVFYGSNSWAYTRLGRFDLAQDSVTDLLSNDDVELKLSAE